MSAGAKMTSLATDADAAGVENPSPVWRCGGGGGAVLLALMTIGRGM